MLLVWAPVTGQLAFSSCPHPLPILFIHHSQCVCVFLNGSDPIIPLLNTLQWLPTSLKLPWAELCPLQINMSNPESACGDRAINETIKLKGGPQGEL